MKAYTNEEIAAYYDTTEVHYERGWDLRHSLAMHYGYWDEKATTFRASLRRMNEALAAFGKLTSELLRLGGWKVEIGRCNRSDARPISQLPVSAFSILRTLLLLIIY